MQSKSGSDLEIRILSDMTYHHGATTMMTGPVHTAGEHADLYAPGKNIVISQGQQVRHMDEWRQGRHEPASGPQLGNRGSTGKAYQ